ncbi:MAG: hypothetical protein ABSH52_34435 [Terriglobia bacterium]|jgi:hypothetical protein
MALDLSTEIVVRWSECDPKLVSLLKAGGVTTVLASTRNEGFEAACRNAGLKVEALIDIQFLALDSAGGAAPHATVALTNGTWPGVSRGPRLDEDEFTAGASAAPWVDANGYLYGMLRALYPDRPALLGYLSDEKAGVKPETILPYDSLESALIEAWVNGGNYLLSLEPRYRARLLRGEAKALAAWRRLGRTARWLVENGRLFGQPTFPAITVLVEANDGLAEITNLLYRQNTSPALAPAANPPAPDPSRVLALVAVGIQAPGAEIRRRILSHAQAGTSLVVDAPGENAWWRDPQLKLVRRQEDREFYSLGRGQMVAYREAISEPYEFALDVIDIVTQKRRAARLWNAPTAIALATSSPPGANHGRALLHLINYGSRLEGEVLVAVQGSYSRATLLRPEGPARSLPTAKRGTTTEVTLPDLDRVGTLVLE